MLCVMRHLACLLLALACRADEHTRLLQITVQRGDESNTTQGEWQHCHTAEEGEECYEKVMGVMRTGLAPLTNDSSFEDFQRLLHSSARLSHVCPEPCTVQSPGAAALVLVGAPARAEDCRTSVEGEECYEKVLWAMRSGIGNHPEWYAPLTRNSSFEEFQRLLHSASNVCPEPCAVQTLGAVATTAPPARAEGCYTSVEGEECYEKVVWAMRSGMGDHPEWYAPLTNDSSFEDFQRLLHSSARLSHVCPEPCAVQPAAPPARAEECHTSVEGEECYEKVVWAMRSGMGDHPEWYAPLTSDSSFEDIQRLLHSTARLSHVCPEPCPSTATVDRVGPPRTDACDTGWYLVVVGTSPGATGWYCEECTDGETRRRRATECTACPSGEVDIGDYDDCIPSLGTPNPTSIPIGTPMPTEMHYDDILGATYPGYEQSATNCHCGNLVTHGAGVVDTDYWSVELCAETCNTDPDCLSFGLHPWQSFWNGRCELYDAPCNYTDGHAANTTCADPAPPESIIVVFNRVPTPSPTPAPPTPASTFSSCDVADGSSPSQDYPCRCGSATCLTSEICSADSCAPMGHLRVQWPCTNPDIGGQYFTMSGVSAAGAPAYSNGAGVYLYWDSACDGSGSGHPRWIVDADAPDVTRSDDLDGDGTCSYFGHHASTEPRGIALGSTSWSLYCDGAIVDMTVVVTYEEAPLTPLATPSPTMTPGSPCTCDPCGSFHAYDLDKDGCLVEEEWNKVDAMMGTFADMDSNGDGCVNQTECAASPNSADLPRFVIEDPPECDYGSYMYLDNSTSPPSKTCYECEGETRRRRATECTECPAGKIDAGAYDGCLAPIWLTEAVPAGQSFLPVNGFVDESGIDLTRGDGIIVRTRNPGHFERFIITDRVAEGESWDLARLEANGSVPYATIQPPFFILDHPTRMIFGEYDPIISTCTMINGVDLSNTYPCGCGVETCEAGERCDMECTVVGEGDGENGCCVKPGWTPLPTPVPTVQAIGDPHLVNVLGEHFDINHEGQFVLLRIPQDTARAVEMALHASIRPEHARPCTTYITEVELFGAWLGDKSVQVRSYSRSHSSSESDRFLGMRVLSLGAASEAPWKNITDWNDGDIVTFDQEGGSAFRVTLSKAQWFSKKGAGKGSPTVAGQFLVSMQSIYQDSTSAVITIRQDLPGQEHLNVAIRHLAALGRADIGGLLGFDEHPGALEDVSPECQRHRDGLDGRRGPRWATPAWKTRWENIKQRHDRDHAGGGHAEDMNDNEAAASLFSTERSKMCVCPGEERADLADASEGVVADFQVGRLAEATWD